jgi:hypothetical protein
MVATACACKHGILALKRAAKERDIQVVVVL